MKNKIVQPFLFDDMYDSSLKLFEDIHNYIYANDGLSEQQVLEEMTKILFIKYYDEKKESHLFFISDIEYSKLSLNNKNPFFKRINQLFNETKTKYSMFFDNADHIKLSLQSLAFVVKKLQKINLKNSKNDSSGLAFQKFLSRHAKSGRGQFFTPDPIINFCVEIIRPTPNETIIDPACGTGGFLLSSLKYIEKNFPKTNIKNYIKNKIFGIEINNHISQIAKIKILIQYDTDPNFLCGNALINIQKLSKKYKQVTQINNLKNTFDIILTNPPFGTQGKITNQMLLSQYDLGYKWNKKGTNFIKSNAILKGQVPEILFIERCLRLLRPNGRMGIVLPNGHLENHSLEYLRKYIKNIANIISVVILPQETFIPYGTGVKASLLFLQKKDGKPINKNQVFFSKINKIGYMGNKNGSPLYKKDNHGKALIKNGSKILDEDFSEVINDYNKFLQTLNIKNDKSFSISTGQLANRFDYNYYHPKNLDLINNLKKSKAPKLSNVAEIMKTKSNRLKNDEFVQYIELSDIYTKSFEIVNSTFLPTAELPSRASYELKFGDIITAVAGNSIGTSKHATAYVTEEFEGAICTNGFRVLRNFSIDHFYLLYYLQSNLFLRQVYMYRTGAAIPALSDTDFFNILIYLPPEDQIKKISMHVEKAFNLRRMAKEKIKSIKNSVNIENIIE